MCPLLFCALDGGRPERLGVPLLYCLQSYAKKTSYTPCVVLFFSMLEYRGIFVTLPKKNLTYRISVQILRAEYP